MSKTILSCGLGLISLVALANGTASAQLTFTWSKYTGQDGVTQYDAPQCVDDAGGNNKANLGLCEGRIVHRVGSPQWQATGAVLKIYRKNALGQWETTPALNLTGVIGQGVAFNNEWRQYVAWGDTTKYKFT
jgi:hypothetical protein